MKGSGFGPLTRVEIAPNFLLSSASASAWRGTRKCVQKCSRSCGVQLILFGTGVSSVLPSIPEEGTGALGGGVVVLSKYEGMKTGPWIGMSQYTLLFGLSLI